MAEADDSEEVVFAGTDPETDSSDLPVDMSAVPPQLARQILYYLQPAWKKRAMSLDQVSLHFNEYVAW